MSNTSALNPHNSSEGVTLSTVSDVAEMIRADLRKSRPFPTGTVIAWTSVSSGNGIGYDYAAIFANGRWYTTIVNDNVHVQRTMAHADLMNYFAERGDHLRDLRVATQFEAVAF